VVLDPLIVDRDETLLATYKSARFGAASEILYVIINSSGPERGWIPFRRLCGRADRCAIRLFDVSRGSRRSSML
jgi:hypothetical protein